MLGPDASSAAPFRLGRSTGVPVRGPEGRSCEGHGLGEMLRAVADRDRRPQGRRACDPCACRRGMRCACHATVHLSVCHSALSGVAVTTGLVPTRLVERTMHGCTMAFVSMCCSCELRVLYIAFGCSSDPDRTCGAMQGACGLY